MVRLYSVWVDGGEVNDYYLTWEQALSCKKEYVDMGYENVVIRWEVVV